MNTWGSRRPRRLDTEAGAEAEALEALNALVLQTRKEAIVQDRDARRLKEALNGRSPFLQPSMLR
jgi:hypothetical protein